MADYKGERIQLVFSEADHDRLLAQYRDLQARRLLSLRVTFNQWLASLSIERADQLAQETTSVEAERKPQKPRAGGTRRVK